MMFTIHTRRCPDYLADAVQAYNSDPTLSHPLTTNATLFRDEYINTV